MQSPYEFVILEGLIVPDTEELLAQVNQEYKSAFSSNLNVNPETPQGTLIAGEVAARSAVVANNAALANQINPNYAGGVFLDAIWALMAGGRFEQTHSRVPVDLTGVPGTTIPISVQVKDANGNLWAPVEVGVLSETGALSTIVEAVEAGPISAAPNTITQIEVGVLGLETVNNPTASTIGSLTESDQSARLRRTETLSLQGLSVPAAIISALNNVPSIRRPLFRENPTGTPIVIDDITLIPHSIYACIDGGTDLEAATILVEKKTAGAAYNGTVEVPVLEPASGQTYLVKFDRPTPVPVVARVTVRQNTAVGNITTRVRDSILAYAAGQLEGQPGFVVGASVSCFELAAAIYSQNPTLFILNVEISKLSDVSYSNETILLKINEIATIISGGIQVIIV